MSSRRGKEKQEAAFEFTPDNLKEAQAQVSKYPEGRQASAVKALLFLAQKQNGGWLNPSALDYVAHFLSMPLIRVYEVATFYNMFHLKPVGEHHIQVCTTTPCWLRGSDEIVDACKKHLGVDLDECTVDGKFSLARAECLGACVNAPVVQIGDYYFEDLDPKTAVDLIKKLADGKKIKPGSSIGRLNSAPTGYHADEQAKAKKAQSEDGADEAIKVAKKAKAEDGADEAIKATTKAKPKTRKKSEETV